MDYQKSPFLKLDKQNIVGRLKASGAKDRDILHAEKDSLISLAKFPKLAGIYVMVLGVLLTLTILGAFLGIPLLIFGWWMMRRGKRNLVAVEEGYAEYAASLGN
ncbi:MAG: DUF5362 family protein [Terriglobia bacterium]